MRKQATNKMKRLATDAGLVVGGLVAEKFVEKGIDYAVGKIAPSITTSAHYGKIKGAGAVAVGVGAGYYIGKQMKTPATKNMVEKASIGVISGGVHSILKETTGLLAGLAKGTTLGSTNRTITYTPSASRMSNPNQLSFTPKSREYAEEMAYEVI